MRVKRTALTVRPPKWIKPQLTRLVGDAPIGKDWLHEIKNDGYRMHAWLDGDKDPITHGLGLVASILAHHRTPALTQGEVTTSVASFAR
jgi:ATP-dependent DNA ligase